MLDIEKVVNSLQEEEYQRLKKNLVQTRAVKFLDLLENYRNKGSEAEFITNKGLTKNAFNVLKSRLYEKVQLHLVNTEIKVENNLLLQIFNLPNLIFNEDRDISLTVLDGLEKEFEQHDLFQLLMLIHAAQKKVTYGSPKYYHYSRLYNKSVAYCLSQDKAEVELMNFNMALSKHYLSKSAEFFPFLKIHRNEIGHIVLMNDSPRFKILQSIIDISLQILAPEIDIEFDATIEENIRKANEYISAYPNDLHAPHFQKAVNYLSFLYYSQIGLQKNATQGLEQSFLPEEFTNYATLVCTAPYVDNKLQTELKASVSPVFISANHAEIGDEENQQEIFNYYYVRKYNAIAAYLGGDGEKALSIVRDVVNLVSFKNIPFAEIEIKFLYIIFSILMEKESNVESILNSVIRKIRDLGKKELETEHFNVLVRIIKLNLTRNPKENKEKLTKMLSEFSTLNKGKYSIFKPLFTDAHFNKILLS